MRFRNGMARLTIVGVAVFELILIGNTFRAWTELSEAEKRLAALPALAPSEDDGQSLSGRINETRFSSAEEILRSGAEDSARRDYEYAAATVETRRGELYLFLSSLIAFPLAAALIFQLLFWIGRGFRSQPA